MIRESLLGEFEMGFWHWKLCRLLGNPVPQRLQVSDLLDFREV
jgi:hypothetical protein